MCRITTQSVTFADGFGGRYAKITFVIDEAAATAETTVSVQLTEFAEYAGETTTLLDEDAVISEARRKLHEFATQLADETRRWAPA